MYREHIADLVTGRIDLWWAECAPPPAGQLSLSMREALGEHHFSNQPVRLAEPRAYAANFSFRREVFAKAGPFRTDIGRSGLTGRLAHEETVFARRAMAAGAGGAGGASFWYAPQAIVRHFVPASSLTDDFFTRSAYWGSVSTMMTMEPFGAGEAVRTLIKSPLRVAMAQSGVIAARLTGNPAAASRARMDRAGAAGRLRGLVTRLTATRPTERGP
jgi:hypothetical protein